MSTPRALARGRFAWLYQRRRGGVSAEPVRGRAGFPVRAAKHDGQWHITG